MKKIALLVGTFLVINLAYAQTTKTINITLGNLTCRFQDDLRPASDAGFRLMSMVFSSKEFQDSLRKLTFLGNACIACGSASINTGEAIMNVLFAQPQKTWNMVIKRKGGALGETSPGSSYTTAYYENISDDMCNLPFGVALAVNLCHEYMHHICFCHPKKPKDKYWRKPSNGNKCDNELYDPVSYTTDVAYRVGWIAYDILHRWYKEGKLAGLY